MSRMLVAAALAVLMWVWPAQPTAAFETGRSSLLSSLEEKGILERIAPVSSRFSFRIHGGFAYGRFGGRGYYRGNKWYHPYRPYKYGRYYGNRYHYKPFFRHDRLGRDPFFYDRRGRFDDRGFWSPYYSPFGTRRHGW